MKIEEHEKAYREHMGNIERAIENGIEENQRNIGYNVSQGSVELFAIYLHKFNLVQGSGDQFDHRIFKSKNMIKKKIPPKFQKREQILEIMKSIESERIPLCYGSRKLKERIEIVIKNFNKLRGIINKELENAKK